MYKRPFKFFNDNIFHELQFGFKQDFSTTHGLINLTENRRQALDERKIGCGILVGRRKTFDIVER